MHRFPLFLILSILLFSCAKENFTLESQSLKRKVEANLDSKGSLSKYKESLVLSARFSLNDLDYSFQIKSPDKELTWEGDYKDGGIELALTPGASFPEGDYHAIFYGDNGTESVLDIHLASIEYFFPYINQSRQLVTRRNATVIEYSEDGKEIKRTENATSGFFVDENTTKVVIEVIDRYQNTIISTQEL